jgi:hypothetical protein
MSMRERTWVDSRGANGHWPIANEWVEDAGIVTSAVGVDLGREPARGTYSWGKDSPMIIHIKGWYWRGNVSFLDQGGL